MSIPLLVLLLSAFSSADFVDEMLTVGSLEGPTCHSEVTRFKECVEPHRELVNTVLENIGFDVLYNIGIMNKGLQLAKNVSECLGDDLECEAVQFAKFTLDYGDDIGKKVYGDAFHCFINADVIHIRFASCSPGLNRFYEPMTENEYHNKTLQAMECVAKKLYKTPSCTVDRIADLYQAGKALSDAYYMYLKWALMKEPVLFKYDGDKYCDN